MSWARRTGRLLGGGGIYMQLGTATSTTFRRPAGAGCRPPVGVSALFHGSGDKIVKLRPCFIQFRVCFPAQGLFDCPDQRLAYGLVMPVYHAVANMAHR